MDTLRLRETLQAELQKLARTRDELRLQAALGKAETRSEMNRLESVWLRVQEELRRLGEHTLAPAAEIGGAARSLVEELAQGYGRIRRDLEDAGLSNVAQRGLSAFATGTSLREAASLQGPIAEAERAAADTPFTRALERIAAQVGGRADARAIFAAPVTKDGVTVIPVARVFGGFGFGASGGDDANAPAAPGMGGGGGFGAQPVGFIEVDRAGARFHRIDNRVDSWFDVASLGLDALRRVASFALNAYKRRKA